MDASKGNAAVKVGIFVVVGMMLFLWFSLKSEGPGFSKKKYELYAYFEKTNGLVEGDPVTLAGVQIGKVKALIFDTSKQQIKAVLDVYEDYKIKKDSKATIALKSIMGQKYIDITFGSVTSDVLKNGDTIQTYKKADFDDVITNVGDMTEEAKKLMDSLNKNQDRVLKQLAEVIEENKGDFKKITKSLGDASPKVEHIVASVDKFTGEIAEGKGTIGKLISNDEVYNNVKLISGDVKSLTGKVKAGEGSLGKFINEDTIHKDAEKTLTSLSDAGINVSGVFGDNKENVKSIVTSTKEISDKVNQGDGTLGKLINDPTLFNDAKRAVNQIEESFEENQEQTVLRTFLGVVLGTVL